MGMESDFTYIIGFHRFGLDILFHFNHFHYRVVFVRYFSCWVLQYANSLSCDDLLEDPKRNEGMCTFLSDQHMPTISVMGLTTLENATWKQLKTIPRPNQKPLFLTFSPCHLM